MPKYVVVPQIALYPVPEGCNPVTGEFDTLEQATAAASAALNVSPKPDRAVCQVVSRLSASVAVATVTAVEEEAPASK